MAENKEQVENKIGFYSSSAPPYNIFSNFAPLLLIIDGKEYATGEHYFQAAKFFKTDPEWAEKIRDAVTSLDAKRMGASRAHPIIPQWDDVWRYQVMREIIYTKATQHPIFLDLLVKTKDAYLYEDNPYDSFWGVGKDGKGLNHLGKMLMEFRGQFLVAKLLNFVKNEVEMNKNNTQALGQFDL